MKQKKYIAAVGLLVLVFLLGGCAKPPTEEMNNALSALTRAENDGDASAYAGNIIVRARDTFTRMQAEADAKRYDAARALAAEVITAADKAIADGRAAAERTRAEAANLVSSLKAPLAETETSLKAAKEVKKIKLDFNALTKEFEQARNDAGEAERDLLSGSYQNAREKALNVRSNLGGIDIQISDAVRAASHKQ
jgi:hypothetical protein